VLVHSGRKELTTRDLLNLHDGCEGETMMELSSFYLVPPLWGNFANLDCTLVWFHFLAFCVFFFAQN
jgi:hypothetical protein